jgi:hypothetical protein
MKDKERAILAVTGVMAIIATAVALIQLIVSYAENTLF